MYIKRVIYLMTLLVNSLTFSCIDSIDIRGEWKVVNLDSNLLEMPENGFLYKVFYDALDENSIIYVGDSTIEFPLGFNRLSSLSLSDNYLGYEYNGSAIKFILKDTSYIYNIQQGKKNNFSLLYDNKQIIGFERQESENHSQSISRIELNATDEFFSYRAILNVDSVNDTISYYGNSDKTLVFDLSRFESDYIKNLAERIQFSSLEKKYNSSASDITSYELNIKFFDGKSQTVWSNGYRSMPMMPFELQALILNIEKLARKYYMNLK